MLPLLGQVRTKLESIGSLQKQLADRTEGERQQREALQKEREHASVAQANAERRYEALKADMRELMRKEQEQEDRLETLAEEKKAAEERLTELLGKKEESANCMKLAEETRERLNSGGGGGG